MKPHGKCPEDGQKHDLDKRIMAIGLRYPDGKLEPVADVPGREYWYCKKCKQHWKR